MEYKEIKQLMEDMENSSLRFLASIRLTMVVLPAPDGAENMISFTFMLYMITMYSVPVP